MLLASILAATSLACGVVSDPLPADLCGPWRAVLASPGGELPFELVFDADPPRARILNGAEEIRVPDVSFADGELVIPFAEYDSVVRAKLAPNRKLFEGTWTKRTAKERPCELAFRAVHGSAPRFEPENGLVTDVSGRWRVTFAGEKQPAVAVFEQDGASVTGTFLTTTGDYRYLAGSCDDGHLRLSCFDGAHAFLFDARLERGELSGTFHSGDTWHDTWTAVRDEEAKLADAWKLVQPSASVPLGLLTYPDLEGQPHSLAEWLFDSRTLIVVLFGSWCPNCHDEMRDLAALDAELRPRGLTILGLAFEYTGDFARDSEQVRRALARHGATYPALLAGRASKELATQAFPLLGEVQAFPTTLFLHRDGRVRAVHTGYAGPGTGAEHTALVAEFRRIALELVEEPDANDQALRLKLASGRWLDRPYAFLTTIFANGVSLQCQSDDPAIEPNLAQRTLHPVRMRGSSVAFDARTIYHYDPDSPALLDPYDAGHRLGAEAPTSKPVPEPLEPVLAAHIPDALRSSNPRLRRDALFSAVRYFRTGHLPVSVDPTPLIADVDLFVRCQAAWAAGELGTHGAVAALLAASQHGFAPLRRECAHALGRLRAVEAKTRLEELTRDLDPLVRAHARTALAALAH